MRSGPPAERTRSSKPPDGSTLCPQAPPRTAPSPRSVRFRVEIGPVPRRDRSGSFANEPAGKALAGTDGAVAMAADLQAVKGRTNGLRADSCITLRQHKICIRRSAELTRIKRRPLDVPCGRTQDDSRRRPQGRAEPFKSARRWDSPCRTPAPPTPTPPLITDPIRQRVRFACGPRN